MDKRLIINKRIAVKKNIFKIFSCVILVSICQSVFAIAIGWHWYNEMTPIKEHIVKPNSKKTKTAVEKISQLQTIVRESKAKAILYPTEENVRDYMILQNLVAHKAALFSNVWQKVLLDFPELNYAILHPTENNAQHIIYEQEKDLEISAISAYRENYGMFFFYRGNNRLDQELAPTIFSFSQDNKIALMPISMDGKIISVFKGSAMNNGQAEKLGIKYFPALILVDPKHHIVQPLNYGFISYGELRRRFLQVATQFEE